MKTCLNSVGNTQCCVKNDLKKHAGSGNRQVWGQNIAMCYAFGSTVVWPLVSLGPWRQACVQSQVTLFEPCNPTSIWQDWIFPCQTMRSVSCGIQKFLCSFEPDCRIFFVQCLGNNKYHPINVLCFTSSFFITSSSIMSWLIELVSSRSLW